jgi:hypothetical protein
MPKGPLVAAICLIAVTSCSSVAPRKPQVVFDETFELQKDQVRAIPVEIAREGSELKIEVSNLEGEALYSVLVTQKDRANLESKQQWRYFTAFSQAVLHSRFDSGWRKIAGPAIYNLVLSPHERKKDTNASSPPVPVETPQQPTRVRAIIQVK